MDKFNAIMYGTIEDVKNLIEKEKIDVNEKGDSKGRSLVFLAAIFDKIDIVEYLSKKGADLNARDNYDMSPMDMAAMEGKINLIKRLAELNPETVRAKNRLGETPIFAAAMKGRTDSIECLAKLDEHTKYANTVHARDNDGLTPMFKAAAQVGEVDVIKCLAKLDANTVHAEDSIGMTPVFLAVFGGQKASIECLAKLGVDVNKPAKNGMTLLVLATKCGHADIAAWLRANGAR